MISKQYLNWSQILLISLIGIYDMISVWRTLCIVISRGRDRIKTWITQTKKTQEINHNIKIQRGHSMSVVPRKIRLWETWQLYSVKFSTVGPTRGEDGKNCTKASRGEKIKLTAQLIPCWWISAITAMNAWGIKVNERRTMKRDGE